MNKKDNIELRSEKVRNIIGQIPPGIVRLGISIIFVIIVGIIAFAYFIKFENILHVRAFVQQEEDDLIVLLEIPTNQIKKINPGQKVTLQFNSLPDTHGPKTIRTGLAGIDSTVNLCNKSSYYSGKIVLSRKNINFSKITIREEISIEAKIYLGKTNLISKLFKHQ